MLRGKISAAQITKPIWHIWAPKTQIYCRQTRACSGRQGWKTDTVSLGWWCTWQLLVVVHVTLGLLNLIVWCVPVVIRHYSRALVDSNPGRNYKWAVCICMTPGIWEALNQSHVDYTGCRLLVLWFSFASLLSCPQYFCLYWISVMFPVFLLSVSFSVHHIWLFLFTPPNTLSLLCIS